MAKNARPYETDLYQAAASGDVGSVKNLLASGADVELGKSVRASNCSPLSAAARAGHLNVARLLIARGAQLESRVDVNHFGRARLWTPLMEAASEGHRPLVRLLLEHGANLRFIDEVGWGVVDAALKDTDEVGWQTAEQLGRWLIGQGAPVGKFAHNRLSEIEEFRSRRKRAAQLRASNPGRNARVRYFVLRTRSSTSYRIAGYPKGPVKDYAYEEGKPLARRFPKRATLHFTVGGRKTPEGQLKDFAKALKGGLVLTDFLDNFSVSDCLVASRRVHQLLCGLGATNLEFLPVELQGLDRQPLGGDYGILNVLGAEECIDLEGSKLGSYREDVDSQIDYIERLKLDRAQIPEDALLFRAARRRELFFLREDVLRAFKKARVTGFQVYKAEGLSL